MLGFNEQNKQLNKIFYKFEANGHCYSHMYKYIHFEDCKIDTCVLIHHSHTYTKLKRKLPQKVNQTVYSF